MAVSAGVKGAAALFGGAGAAYGGREIYMTAQSGTWKDELKKLGVSLPDEKDSNFYDRVIKDQKTYMDGQSELKSKSGTELRSWCQEQLQKPFSRWGRGNRLTKDKLTKMCSVSAISSVKGWVIAKHQSTLSFIADMESTKQDQEYKKIFALYRYPEADQQTRFLDWLNEGVNEGQKKTKDTTVEDGYKKLKEKCQKELSDAYPRSEVESLKINRLLWWCTKPDENDTIEKRLTHLNVREKLKNGSLTGLKDKWEHTDRVKNEIKKAMSKTSDPEDTDYKSFCEQKKNEQLTSEGVYQERYIVFGSVCYKEKEKSS